MFIKTSILASALMTMTALGAHGAVNDKAQTQNVRLPATAGVYISESVTIHFNTKQDLLDTLRGPIQVDEEAVQAVANKLDSIIGQTVYPSHIAHLLFELSFTDPFLSRLGAKQRQENLGYIMSNLGEANKALTEHLFAFYYGYSFEHFAPSKN